jgi:hypothetical protein
MARSCIARGSALMKIGPDGLERCSLTDVSSIHHCNKKQSMKLLSSFLQFRQVRPLEWWR